MHPLLWYAIKKFDVISHVLIILKMVVKINFLLYMFYELLWKIIIIIISRFNKKVSCEAFLFFIKLYIYKFFELKKYIIG